MLQHSQPEIHVDSAAGGPAVCQVVVGHRSESVWIIGIPDQSYTEEVEVAVDLITPPVTVVFCPSARNRHHNLHRTFSALLDV